MATKTWLLLAAVLASASVALADGLIVPIRPDLRVAGSWAVKYHHVDIVVRDQVASVAIDQQFVNTGNAPIEVEYLFPVPPQAAIDNLTLVVDGKELTGTLMKADEARAIYEDIVRKKKDPALLEYAGYGLFRTRAFPLEPGKPAQVQVKYKDVCKRTGDTVEVWYPLNTEKYSAKPIQSVEIRVDIKADSGLIGVYSPAHDVKIEQKDPRHVVARYEAKNETPTTDFQLFYRLGNEAVGASLLTHQVSESDHGYFLMLVSPNMRTQGREVLAKNIVLALDCSGSMSGEKLRQAKEAFAFILQNLGQDDHFNVVQYSDSVSTFFDALQPASKENVAQALGRVEQIQAGGGTNIDQALKKATGLLEGSQERPEYIVFLTDGLPTVGVTDENVILKNFSQVGKSARLFAMGVGYDVNVRLLDKLSLQGRGKADYVRKSEPVESKISSLYKSIQRPVMTDLSVQVKGLHIYDVYPRDLGDLFAGDQLVVVGRYAGDDVKKMPSEGAKHISELTLKGKVAGKEESFTYGVMLNGVGRDSRYEFIERLWAVRRIGYLLDQIALSGSNQELVDEVVKLSKQFGIMTPYTSFLADERVRLHDKKSVQAAAENAGQQLHDTVGGDAQRNAMNRQVLRVANQVSLATPSSAQPSSQPMYGNTGMNSYEAKGQENVQNVRQIGNNALYRRGQLWIDSQASGIDPDRDKDKIKIVQRFGSEYFDLAKANTLAENQLLSTQQPDEELLVVLRGQAYWIK